MAQFPPGFFPSFAPPPPPGPPPPPSKNKPRSRGGIVAGVVIFVVVASVLLYIIVCSLRSRQRNSRAAAATAGSETPSESGSVRVDEQPLHHGSPTAGLPMFTYTLSVKHNVTGPGEEAATCSVCLGALQLGETVRLLPVCMHLYHAECIDPWLDGHSTCPICRSDTDPTMGDGQLPDGRPGVYIDVIL